MDVLYLVLVILIGIGGGFVQRVSGFGLGIFTMIFLPHFMPTPTAAAGISTLFSCGTSGYNAMRYRKNVAYKTVLPMIAAALVSISVSVFYSSVVSAKVFSVLLGSALVLLSLYFIFFSRNIKMKPTVTNGILAGTLGGVLGGLFSTGGPPAVVYLSSATKDNLTYFATIQFYFCFTNIHATVMRTINGQIDRNVLVCAAIGMVGCMLGDFAGKQVFDKLDAGTLKRIIYIVMIISGILMFI